MWKKVSAAPFFIEGEFPEPLWHFDMKWAEWNEPGDQGHQIYTGMITSLLYANLPQHSMSKYKIAKINVFKLLTGVNFYLKITIWARSEAPHLIIKNYIQ